MRTVGVAIIAGGKSSRMGHDKTIMKVSSLEYGEETFLERICREMQFFEEKIISLNTSQTETNHSYSGYRIVRDYYSDIGPIGGIYSALRETECDAILCVSCDMPMFNYAEAGIICDAYADEDICIPVTVNSKGEYLRQPLAAIYSKRLLPFIEEMIANKNYKLGRISEAENCKVKEVVFDNDGCFFNVNSPKDLSTLSIRLTDNKKNAGMSVFRDIIRYSAGTALNIKDEVAVETEVVLEDSFGNAVTVAASPGMIDELKLGFAYHFDENDKSVYIDSESCVDNYRSCIHMLLGSSELFKRTGNMHCAALCDLGGVEYMAEDISRHNAIYKVAGACLMDKHMPSAYFLCTTGRIYESVVKIAYNLGIKVIVSKAAPTDRAVDFARNKGIAVYGFASKDRINRYY